MFFTTLSVSYFTASNNRAAGERRVWKYLKVNEHGRLWCNHGNQEN